MSDDLQEGQLWQFTAFDTWFFRESRPFDSIGGAQLASHFPPPARTLAGAIRTAIGEGKNVNWEHFNDGNDTSCAALRKQIGDARSYGQLRLRGPHILQHGERLFPAPLLLLQKDGSPARLHPGDDVIICDLGKVRLPKLEEPLPGAAPLATSWLTRVGIEELLAGGVPDISEDIRAGSLLFAGEDRVGIGRNVAQRTNIEGLLYQTRHIRPLEDVTLGVRVSGLDNEYYPVDGTLRVGGEGRFSSFSITQNHEAPLAMPVLSSNRLLIVLLTHADFDGDWKPAGFEQTEQDGYRIWRGILGQVPLKIICAVLGKTVREGGWDMAGRQPRPLRSLITAGSCYFCEVEGDLVEPVQQLHHSLIGNETELGRGEIAIGQW